MRHLWWTAAAGTVAAAVVLILGVAGSGAALAHGIGGAKNCTSPTKVGDDMFCTYTIRNNSDDFGDTLRAFYVDDSVFTTPVFTTQQAFPALGGNIFSLLSWEKTGAVTCWKDDGLTVPANLHTVPADGDGSSGNPFKNAKYCDMPTGSRLDSHGFSFYEVRAQDYALPNHVLGDLALYKANDLCEAGENCPTVPLTVSPNSQTEVIKRESATETAIHDAAHAPVTIVAAGTTVHDFITVSSADNGPTPTGGDVLVKWFQNGDCSGDPAASATVGPLANGELDATGFAQTAAAPGMYAFQAEYLGDDTYNGSVGACEPLQVVDAFIEIAPPTAVNQTGTNHTLTITVHAVNGTLGNGTATASIVSGPGSFVGSPTCNYTGGTATASCQVTITSSVTGTTVIQATSDISVEGQTITRTTATQPNTDLGGSDNAQKEWAKARISITPTATNEVGQSHTFTVLVERDTGGGFAGAEGAHVDVTLTDSDGAAHTTPTGSCTNVGPNTDANGRCTITFTSLSAGKVTGHATAVVPIPGDGTVTVQTDGTGGSSGDAVKTFVDAYIDITPPQATNATGTTHTYTAHVFVDTGDGSGFVAAPDGTLVTFSFVGSHVGAFSGGSTCTTTGGSCSVNTTSTNPGLDSMQASTTLSVGGVSVTRTTGQQAPGHTNGSNAEKLWIVTHVLNASNQDITGTTVEAPATVHDRFLSAPAAGGTVTFTLFRSNNCSGAVEAGPETVALSNGSALSSPVTLSPGGSQDYSYLAHYNGDAESFPAKDATCEPFRLSVTPPPPPVPDARISISPPTATNPVDTTHVLTAHVDIQTNTGQPFTNAPDGTLITLAVASGPGSFTTANPCTTSGGTGSCTVTLTSAVAGTTVVNATTTVTVSGIPLTRTTNGQAGNSGPAAKTWQRPDAPACESVSARPRQLKVGKRFTVVARAMLDDGSPMANARILLTAPGPIAMTKRTNANGVARFSVKPTKRGTLRLRVVGSPQCTARRGIAPPDTVTG